MPVARSFFQKIPFIRITSLFMTGILLNHYLNFEPHWIAFVLTILISALIFLWHTSNYAAVQIQNLLISIGIVFAGVFYPGKPHENQQSDFNRKEYYLAEVCQKPAEKAKTFQSILQIQNKSLAKPEKVIAYFSKDQFDSTLSTGDQLVILAKPQKIRNKGNPFEFDYQSMMRKKEISYTVFLTEGTYLKTGHSVNRIIYQAELIRDKLLSKLSVTKIEKEEGSVVAALTLGYRAELDPETTDYFASTGAMHVLAVSGLHVGLIYFILGFLLSGIKKVKIGAFLFPALMIILLWSYALITGFSPSVQRATVMLTFVIFGNILRRSVNIYNSLTASALVLILNNPDVLFEVGFQLSFLAVFGIVLIQPKLAGLIEVKNKLLKSLWALLTVSIAAQLATFPLGLFYFNQFPNFFWLSNFFVIPGATLIIWLTFGFFIFSPFPFIPDLIAQLIQWTTSLMLWTLKVISELPHAVSEGIVINPIQLWVIFGILGSILIYVFSKRKQWLFFSLILLITLQSSVFVLNWRLLNQKAIYVYNSRNTFIHLINGRTNYLITNGQDTITGYELNMIQEVQNHLKLDKPLVIDKKSVHEFSSDKLTIKNNEMNFLNCHLKFINQFNNSPSDVLSLTVYEPSQTGKEYTTTTIATDITYFSKDKSSVVIDFNTKLNGAYHLCLH
ncbi:MAG TPA: ComEC/Rec2 family competence protein [Prolixibacteraceae bacterium]|nr:ComEC/Rec2 family competence protein [Prolixibacteraceae bacterium]